MNSATHQVSIVERICRFLPVQDLLSVQQKSAIKQNTSQARSDIAYRPLAAPSLAICTADQHGRSKTACRHGNGTDLIALARTGRKEREQNAEHDRVSFHGANRHSQTVCNSLGGR